MCLDDGTVDKCETGQDELTVVILSEICLQTKHSVAFTDFSA